MRVPTTTTTTNIVQNNGILDFVWKRKIRFLQTKIWIVFYVALNIHALIAL